MDVAIVTHDVARGSGQGRVNYELTRHLLRQGIRVDLIADQVDEDLLAAGANWRPVHPGFEDVFLLKVWHFAQLANRLLARLAGRYDVIMACGVVLDRPHTVNVVHFVHEAWWRSASHPFRNEIGVNSLYQGLFSWMNARWEAQVFEKAQVVVGVSDQIRRELVETVGVPAWRVRAIVNGVDVEEFCPGPAAREPLGLPRDVPLAFFAGDIQSTRKNLGTVLRALVDVPEVHLAVAGDTEGSPYPAQAAALGLADRTHFLGFRRDVPALMRASDFFVFPSRYEACTLVLLEAMASGLPVVTAHTAGGAELVTEDCGMVLDDPENVDGLARAARKIGTDPQRRERMGRAARAVAEAHTWSCMARQYVDLFEHMAETPSRTFPVNA
jgi:glycosyltransferase involved in cell wall biosynthesis